ASPATADDRDVLFTIELIRHGWPHARSQACLQLVELLALVRTVDRDAAVTEHLEHQVAGCRHSAAASTAATLYAPPLSLCGRIPCDERLDGAFFDVGRSHHRRHKRFSRRG